MKSCTPLGPWAQYGPSQFVRQAGLSLALFKVIHTPKLGRGRI
jgi:hypothetical protein